MFHDKQDYIENNVINPMIRSTGQFYYCDEHPEFENIHLEDHLLYSKGHFQEGSTVVDPQ